jgi:hypothetical protein
MPIPFFSSSSGFSSQSGFPHGPSRTAVGRNELPADPQKWTRAGTGFRRLLRIAHGYSNSTLQNRNSKLLRPVGSGESWNLRAAQDSLMGECAVALALLSERAAWIRMRILKTGAGNRTSKAEVGFLEASAWPRSGILRRDDQFRNRQMLSRPDRLSGSWTRSRNPMKNDCSLVSRHRLRVRGPSRQGWSDEFVAGAGRDARRMQQRRRTQH